MPPEPSEVQPRAAHLGGGGPAAPLLLRLLPPLGSGRLPGGGLAYFSPPPSEGRESEDARTRAELQLCWARPWLSLPPQTVFNFINWLLSHSLLVWWWVALRGGGRGGGLCSASAPYAPPFPAGIQRSCPGLCSGWPEAGGWRLSLTFTLCLGSGQCCAHTCALPSGPETGQRH